MLGRTPPGASECGFSVLELTISIIVIGVMLAGVLVPLQTQIESRKLEETQRLLEHARETLLSFVATYGYFPCPADSTSGWQEAPGADHVTGACPGGWHGFLPAGMIGYAPVSAQGFAVDPWGADSGRLRYAVAADTLGGIPTPFTRRAGMSAAGVPSIGAANNLLHICSNGGGVVAGVSCGTAQTLASNAVIVMWSVGRNGGTDGGSSVHEAENPNPSGGTADRIFVSRIHSTAAAAEFDDVLAWVPSTILVTRLMASGQLP